MDDGSKTEVTERRPYAAPAITEDELLEVAVLADCAKEPLSACQFQGGTSS